LVDLVPGYSTTRLVDRSRTPSKAAKTTIRS